MRAFVAFDVSSQELASSLVGFQKELAATGADVRLVEPANLHFTIKFLGEISTEDASRASEILRALRIGAAEVSIVGAGAFPSIRSPSVVWAGVPAGDEEKLRQIATPVLTALEGLGETDRRPFQAHLTLGRVRSGRNMDRLSALVSENSHREFGSFKVDSLKLKSSQLRPGGPVYTDLGVFALQ